MLTAIIDLWFVIVALSLVYTSYNIRMMPISWVQKLGWILVVAYTGPFGLLGYWLSCRSPSIEQHAEYTRATWKQALNSEVHCVAGDATGIILAAVVLSYASLSIPVELILEYIAAFICGWVIFQAGMMRSMYHSYTEALLKTLFAETLSMNFVMIGMIPTMVILMHQLENGRDPSSTHFWFAMAMATIIGSIVAYPANYWLVKNKLKHGCMTLDNKTASEHDEHHQMMMLPAKQQLKIVAITFGLLILITAVTLFKIS